MLRTERGGGTNREEDVGDLVEVGVELKIAGGCKCREVIGRDVGERSGDERRSGSLVKDDGGT